MKTHWRLGLLLCCPVMAWAIPNIWVAGFGQGIMEHTITNTAGAQFVIDCDLGYSDHGDKTQAFFLLADGTDLSPAEDRKVELLIDGNAYWLPPRLGWHNGDVAWRAFTEAIGRATQFEVYVNDQRKARFSPSPQSAEKILADLSDCQYRY